MFKKIAIIISFILIICLVFYTVFLSSLDVSYVDFIYNELKKYKTNLDVSVVLSVIKIESNFNSKAISKKGAVGLMQIMPTTAEFIVEKANFNLQNIDLYDSKTNIKLGIWYLNYLEKKFDNIEYVLCSYNAGEGVVSGWIKDKIPIKDIPYKETKEYLKRFKLYYPHYKNKINIIYSIGSI